MQIQLVNNADTLRIFEFERENKEYFKSRGVFRNPLYYQYNRFINVMNDALVDQSRDRFYMYLILNDEGNIIGRLTFDNVIRSDRHRATVRLVVGKDCDANQVADDVLNQIKDLARSHNLARLEASSAIDDVSWQIALLKGGFKFAGKYTGCIKVAGSSRFTDIVLLEQNL